MYYMYFKSSALTLKFIETTLHLITGGPSSRLEKKPTINSWKRQALCDSVLSYGEEPLKIWTRYKE